MAQNTSISRLCDNTQLVRSLFNKLIDSEKTAGCDKRWPPLDLLAVATFYRNGRASEALRYQAEPGNEFLVSITSQESRV